jgi:hypothetical protein
MTPRCPHCLDDGAVCEDHPNYPAHIKTEGHDGERCGAGMPCPACCSPIPADGTRPISEAFTPDWQRLHQLMRPGDDPVDVIETATAITADYPPGDLPDPVPVHAERHGLRVIVILSDPAGQVVISPVTMAYHATTIRK